MARKADVKKDIQSKQVLDQLNTLTVAAPLEATGLIGDQTPSNRFEATDWDRVRNQVHLQESNVEVINLLNSIGNITGQNAGGAGPMPGTLKIVNTDMGTTESTKVTAFRPAVKGEVWQLIDCSWIRTGSTSLSYFMEVTDGVNHVSLVDRLSSGDTAVEFSDWPGSNVYIDYDNYLTGHFLQVSGGAPSDMQCNCLVVRVR